MFPQRGFSGKMKDRVPGALKHLRGDFDSWQSWGCSSDEYIENKANESRRRLTSPGKISRCAGKKNNYGVLQGFAVNSLCATVIIYVNIEYRSH